MELIIVLLVILVLIMVGLVVGKPSECYECGHRFEDIEPKWWDENGKSLCHECWSCKDKGEEY